MSVTVVQRLQEMGVGLPMPAKSVANYLPCVQVGAFLITSGQLPLRDGKLTATGLLGRELAVEEGQEAAKWCAANVLAQARAAIGDLEKIARLIKITVFVASTGDFTEQHLVANGASDFFVAALGEKGRHARSAVGVAALPINAAVEVEAMFEIG